MLKLHSIWSINTEFINIQYSWKLNIFICVSNVDNIIRSKLLSNKCKIQEGLSFIINEHEILYFINDFSNGIDSSDVW
jgi:hypothetical protein